MQKCSRCRKVNTPNTTLCSKCKTLHDKSAWVVAWRKYQDEITRVGNHRKVLWAAP